MQGRRREREAQRLLTWLASWIPGYSRSVFASERRYWSADAWCELEGDAVQHVLLAAVRRGPDRWARTSDEHALLWTKKVVRNFVVSHYVRARQQRKQIGEPSANASDIDSQIETRLSMLKLAKLLRDELAAITRPRDLTVALNSFDELLHFASHQSSGPQGARARDRAKHRRQRVRRLAQLAVTRLAARVASDAERAEVLELATLFGIVVPPVVEKSSQASPDQALARSKGSRSRARLVRSARPGGSGP